MNANSPVGAAPGGSSAGRRLAGVLGGLPWGLLTAAAVGLYIGGRHGAEYGFKAGAATGIQYVSPDAVTAVTSLGLVLGGLLLGLFVRATSSLRPLGSWILLTTGFAAAGVLIGLALGPKWQGPLQSVGNVRVELAEPVGRVLEAAAVCTTPANDPRISSITANPLGRVGVDILQLGVDLSGVAGVPATADNTIPSVRIGVNSASGYQGGDGSRTVEVSADRRTGKAMFADLHAATRRLGGASGPETIAGSIEWACADPVAATLAPGISIPPTEEANSLEGWFRLHGIVTVDRDTPGLTPPFPGQASGQCSAAFPLGTDSIEGVVPWLNGGQARITLRPGQRQATLTVDLGDDSTPETVSAPANVVFRNAAQNDRELSAVFQLRAGRLELTVDWFCPT